MNVLSLFDGMSCGQIALERAGIKVDQYFASEIDKYAIKVTMAHYHKTVQLGDILNWKSWNLPKIDLLIGGSPCQGFSNAGLGLNFDDPRSKLFFTYVDILRDLKEKNPDLQFLLENVKMKKEWQKVISNLLGVEPVLINSALVSAQNRQRLYWANWKVEQPEDKHIYLKDIIEDGEVDVNKSHALTVQEHKYGQPKTAEWLRDMYEGKKMPQSKKALLVRVQGAAIRNQVTKIGVEEQLNVRKDEKSNCAVPSYPHKSNGVVVKTRYVSRSGEVFEKESLKSNTVREAFRIKDNFSIEDDFQYRKLTPVECERLQTISDNHTDMVSNTQRYKMLGNGFTVDVIAHILNSNPNLR